MLEKIMPLDEISIKIKELLDSKSIKYSTINYSPANSEKDVDNCEYLSGKNLIETTLIKINNHEIAIVVTPMMSKVNLEEFKLKLGTQKVQALSKVEMQELLPHIQYGSAPPFGYLDSADVFLSNEIRQLKDVKFQLGNHNSWLNMNYCDFEQVVNHRTDIDVPTTPKYKAEINNVAPKSARTSFKKHNRCFFGISLENSNFFRPRLAASLTWINNNFDHCSILVGDSIHRITLQIKHDIKKEQALKKALHLGTEFIDHELATIETLLTDCSFDFVLCSEIQNHPEYQIYHEQLLNVFSQNIRFAQSIKKFANAFVGYEMTIAPDKYEKFINMSCQYLLEELAIFACLVKKGIPVMIYPGSINTLVEIANGEHSDVPDDLKHLITVALRIKHR